MRDVIAAVNTADLTSAACVGWFVRDVLRQVNGLQQTFRVLPLGEGTTPTDLGMPVVSESDAASILEAGDRPILLLLDGAFWERRWRNRPPVMVRALVALDEPPTNGMGIPWVFGPAGWLPVLPWRDIAFRCAVAARPRRKRAAKDGRFLVWTGEGSPSDLYSALARGDLVLTTVRDRWTSVVGDCCVRIIPEYDPVEEVLADWLSDGAATRELNRRGRRRTELFTPERFAAALEAVARPRLDRAETGTNRAR